MFTGIIEALGKITRIENKGSGKVFTISSTTLDFADIKLGDSIAVNGVCLTAIELQRDTFMADVSQETISLTTLKHLTTGHPVNLEKALTPSSRLGGHMVSGHVDGIGHIHELKDSGQYITMTVECPEPLAKYIAHKGSVCIDGTSLTVNQVDNCYFDLMIVPHTKRSTIINTYKKRTQVNIEVDLIARYIERLLQCSDELVKKNLTMETLAQHGFTKTD